MSKKDNHIDRQTEIEGEDVRSENEQPSGAEQNEDVQLTDRLWYLLMLMRRGDAGKRGGGRRGRGFHGQGRVLRLLALQSPTTQKELGYLLGIRPQSLAEQLSRLEEAGLVKRHPNPADRRTSIVELTEKGREAIEAQEKISEADPFAVLSDEEKLQFAALLDRVIVSAEANLPEGLDPRLRAFKARAFGEGDDTYGPGFGGPGFGRPGFEGPGGPDFDGPHKPYGGGPRYGGPGGHPGGRDKRHGHDHDGHDCDGHGHRKGHGGRNEHGHDHDCDSHEHRGGHKGRGGHGYDERKFKDSRSRFDGEHGCHGGHGPSGYYGHGRGY